MRISDWSSDVCSSDLRDGYLAEFIFADGPLGQVRLECCGAGMGFPAAGPLIEAAFVAAVVGRLDVSFDLGGIGHHLVGGLAQPNAGGAEKAVSAVLREADGAVQGHAGEAGQHGGLVVSAADLGRPRQVADVPLELLQDRKSTRLNSSP